MVLKVKNARSCSVANCNCMSSSITEAINFVGTDHVEVAQTQGCCYSFMDILVEIQADKERGIVIHHSSQARDDRQGVLSVRTG